MLMRNHAPKSTTPFDARRPPLYAILCYDLQRFGKGIDCRIMLQALESDAADQAAMGVLTKRVVEPILIAQSICAWPVKEKL